MIGFYNYTVILTYIGLLSGVVGITQASEGHHAIAFLCLVFSGLCDLFDGKIARTKKDRTPQEKLFGIQIDSLADLVCFGVLPAVIGYSYPSVMPLRLGSALLIVLCGLIRLAAYNVNEEERQKSTEENRKNYQGLPITTTSIILPLIYLGRHNISPQVFPYVFQGFMVLMAVLFVCNINVKKLSMKGVLVMLTLGALILLGYLKLEHII